MIFPKTNPRSIVLPQNEVLERPSSSCPHLPLQFPLVPLPSPAPMVHYPVSRTKKFNTARPQSLPTHYLVGLRGSVVLVHGLLSVIRFSFAFRSSEREEAYMLSDEVGTACHSLMSCSTRHHTADGLPGGFVCAANCVEVKAFTLLACHVFSVAATRL